jgi:hypothetical protein
MTNRPALGTTPAALCVDERRAWLGIANARYVRWGPLGVILFVSMVLISPLLKAYFAPHGLTIDFGNTNEVWHPYVGYIRLTHAEW